MRISQQVRLTVAASLLISTAQAFAGASPTIRYVTESSDKGSIDTVTCTAGTTNGCLTDVQYTLREDIGDYDDNCYWVGNIDEAPARAQKLIKIRPNTTVCDTGIQTSTTTWDASNVEAYWAGYEAKNQKFWWKLLQPGETYSCDNVHAGFVEGTSIYKQKITFPSTPSTQNQTWQVVLWWEADVKTDANHEIYSHSSNCSYMWGHVTWQGK